MSKHYLHFLENEDEAQMTGYKFVVNGETVVVSQTFHHPEYESFDIPQIISVVEARKLWKKLIKSGQFKEN